MSANKGEAFPLIIQEFEDSGYVVSHKVINAADYAVPQKRERIIIVGFRKNLGKKFIFPEPVVKTINAYVPLSTIIEENVPEKYFFSKRAVEGMVKSRTNMNMHAFNSYTYFFRLKD